MGGLHHKIMTNRILILFLTIKSYKPLEVLQVTLETLVPIRISRLDFNKVIM